MVKNAPSKFHKWIDDILMIKTHWFINRGSKYLEKNKKNKHLEICGNLVPAFLGIF